MTEGRYAAATAGLFPPPTRIGSALARSREADTLVRVLVASPPSTRESGLRFVAVLALSAALTSLVLAASRADVALRAAAVF